MPLPYRDEMMREERHNPKQEYAVQATVWFSVWVHAHLSDEFGQMARAQRELKRLGVSVRFRDGMPRVETGT